MDDTAQKPNGNVSSQTSPVGTTSKEVSPPVSDYVAPAPEAGPIVKDQEVAAAGIAEVEREIQVEEKHKEMGIKPESAPVITEPKKVNAQSLMTPEEIRADLRKTGMFNFTGHYLGIYIANSRDFLAALLNKILRKPAAKPA
jgi:hypothetical protein